MDHYTRIQYICKCVHISIYVYIYVHNYSTSGKCGVGWSVYVEEVENIDMLGMDGGFQYAKLIHTVLHPPPFAGNHL